MAENYVIDHDTYLMNHENGDVLKVTVDNKAHSIKKIQLYRQDGLGNYYIDKHSQLRNLNDPDLATKKGIIRISKKIGAHNTHHIEKWHHKVTPIYNTQHQVTDFEPKLSLKHHAQVQNAKRYVRHLNHHHADFLFFNNHRGFLKHPLIYLKDALYEDRNKEIVVAHQVHKLAR